MNTAGWNMQGNAQIENVNGFTDSELVLCPNVLSSNGSIFFNQPINLSLCSKWTAEYDFRMYDGDGADGMAFCFLDVPPVGYVLGGGLGIPNTANGLKVCFDTWNNCIDYDSSTVHLDMPKIEIRWGQGYNSTSFNTTIVGECLPEPTRDNSDGRISYIRGPNYNHAKITYDSGNISVYVNDTLYLTGYQQFNFTGYLGFTASTGGYSDNHSIKNVIIYTQMPPSYAGNPMSFCPYDTVRLGAPSTPGYVYAWSPPTGLNDTTSSAPLLHLSNSSGNSSQYKYYVHTSFGSNPGCASIDSVIVKLYSIPTVNFVMPSICLTDITGQFYDSSYTSDSSTLPFSYQWNFGDPYATPANPNSSILQNPTHQYSAASNYDMTLVVTNSQGCIDSASKIFTVNGTVPQSAFSIIDPTGLCNNEPVGVTNLSTVNFGSIVAVQIYWGDSSGVSYTDSLPYGGKVYWHRYPDPVTTSDTTYTIRMVSASGKTCDDASGQPVIIQPSPHLLFAPIPTVCDYNGKQIQITEASELTGLPGSISFYGRQTSRDGIFSPWLAGPGTDTLLSVFVAANGCVDSANQTVFVQALPKVSAGNDTAVVVNQPLQLHALSSDSTPDSYLWSPPTGLNDPAIADPIAILSTETDSITYIVTVTDTAGCMAQASIEVTVFKTLPDILVPNAFTPGKSTNNIFRPIAPGISSLQGFSVYNRWGQLQYSTTRIGDGWDGTVSGKAQPVGTYVWTVEGTTYTGKHISKKGTMILIR